MPALLQLPISLTRKRVLSSTVIPAPIDLPPLYNHSRVKGTVSIWQETGDPSNPVAAIDDIVGGSVALTAGGVTLVTAIGFTYSGNTMSFVCNIVNDILDTLLLASPQDFVEVIMEIRFETATQEDTALREVVPIFNVDADIPDAPASLTFTDSDSCHWSLITP